LYGTEIILFILLVLTLYYRLKNPDDEINFLNLKILNFYILIILFFIVTSLSLFFAQDGQVAFYYLIKFLEGFALLLFIINFKFSYKKLGWAIVLAGVFQAVLAIYQFLTQKVWASKWLGMAEQLSGNGGVSVVESTGLRWLRAYGSLPNPNVLAGFLAVCLIVFIVLIILSNKQKSSILLWAFLPILLSGLFFTFSKSGLLAFLLGFAFVFIFVFFSQDQKTKFILIHVLFVILVVFGSLSLIYQDPLMTRLKGETRLEQKSYNERALYFEDSQILLKENWLKGVGLGNYTLALYDQSSQAQPVWTYQPVHNVFILMATEIGVIGFLIFILLIIEVFHKLWHFKIKEQLKLINVFKLFKFTAIYYFYQRRFYWFLGLLAIFFMLLIIMFFDHYIWTLYFGIIFWWLMLGLWLKQVSLMK
jgi:O-antigen ligase